MIKYFLPFPFAFFSFLFYIILFNPVVPSGDFITAILIFWSALGCAAIVLFSKEKRPRFLYLYVSIAIIFSILTPLVLKKFSDPWHMVLVGLIVLGLTWLKFFVSGHLRHEEKK